MVLIWHILLYFFLNLNKRVTDEYYEVGSGPGFFSLGGRIRQLQLKYADISELYSRCHSWFYWDELPSPGVHVYLASNLDELPNKSKVGKLQVKSYKAKTGK